MQDIIEQVETISPEKSDNEAKTTSIGKFEDSEALLKAYNNLQAEFTRKSQLLKELTEKDEVKSTRTENSGTEVIQDVPMYERAEWKDYLDGFLEKNPMAKKYAKELAAILIEDDALNKDKHCLEVALARVLTTKIADPEKILEDDDMRSFVLQDKGIKDSIISSYIESLSSINVPKTISRGGEITAAPPRRIKTIEEAGALAAEIIKNRRK